MAVIWVAASQENFSSERNAHLSFQNHALAMDKGAHA